MLEHFHSYLSSVDTSPLPNLGVSDGTLIQSALQIVFAVFGAVALIVITVAGLKYVLSRGDPQAIVKSKNTIIYAVVGLVVAVSAEAIVSFVIHKAT